MTFQEIILTLQNYWAAQKCVIGQPYDVEKGAGTMNPANQLFQPTSTPTQVGDENKNTQPKLEKWQQPLSP